MGERSLRCSLPEIPVLDVGPDFPYETLVREEARARALLDDATHQVPRRALQALDAVSRRWLERHANPYLPEISFIARRLRRPGAYFLSVMYEWGCTCQVAPSPESASAILLRVLDWRTPGLGRHVIAARVKSRAGAFVTLTWPGYTGVLQGLAPGRFAAALNQAPMRRPIGLYALDWAANRARVWRMPYPMPAHLLREVFETAATFSEARRLLSQRPISSPAIFSLTGTSPREAVIIERTELRARQHEGCATAANHWQAYGWHGTARGIDSCGRSRLMRAGTRKGVAFDPSFPWLTRPVLNPLTRLAMAADARTGMLMAQGFEREAPATAPLELHELRELQGKL